MNEWTVENGDNSYDTGSVYLVNPQGYRVAKMTRARAKGIAAALNTEQGREAFEKARNE